MKKTSFTSKLLNVLGKSSVIVTLSLVLVGTVAALSVNWEETVLYATVTKAVEKLTSSEAPPKVEKKIAKVQRQSSFDLEENLAFEAYISDVCACDDGSGNITFNVTISNWPTTGGPFDVGILYTRDPSGTQVVSDGLGGTPADPSGQVTIAFGPVSNATTPTGTVALVSIISQADNSATTIIPDPVPYTVTGPVDVTCPADVTEVSCQTQADINSAFDAWLLTASYTGGCHVGFSNDGTVYPNACGETKSVTFTAIDNGCGSTTATCTAIFTVEDAPIVTLTCPLNTTETACQTQADIDVAFSTWLGTVINNGGCNAIISDDHSTAPASCGGSATVTWTVASSCQTDETCFATFTVASAPTLSVTCPVDATEVACQDQAVVDAAFAAWIAGFVNDGGCNTTATDLSTSTAPDVCTGGTTTVVYIATDDCGQTGNCTALFVVDAPPTLVLSCPIDATEASCQDQTAIDAAFAAWLGTVTYSGGCNATISDDNTGAPDACGGSTTVTWTLTDDCGASRSCSATFTVTAAPALSLTCPVNQSESSCQTQSAIDAAFAAWLNTPSPGGGCSPSLTNNNTGAPDACGGIATVTFTLADDCNSFPCTATFTVTDAPALTLNCPTPTAEAACQTQAAINAAFTAWLATVGSAGGCNVVITNDATGAPLACGGSVDVKFTAKSDCESDKDCNSTFTVLAPTPVSLIVPTDTTEAACQTQVAIDAAFSAWLSVASFSGGCNATISNDNVGAPDACGGSTTVTWTVPSDCEPDKILSATFTVTAPDPFDLTCPDPLTINTGKTQAEADADLAAWVATVSMTGGCTPVLVNDAPVSAPDICTGGTVTVTFTATPVSCDLPKTCSSTFTVPPTDLDVDPQSPFTSTCSGVSATLAGNPSGGAEPYTHTWTAFPVADVVFSDATVENPVATFGGSGGLITLTYSVTDAGGCTKTKSFDVYVSATCDPEFDITDPCICNDDADVNFDNGTFMELISITGPNGSALPSGQTWTISFVNGAYTASPLNEETTPGPQGAPIVAGQLLQYCDPVANPAGCTVYNSPGGTILTALPGSYFLVFAHVDHEGYVIQAQGPAPDTDGDPATIEPGNFALATQNVCYYPQPTILNLPPQVCQNAAVFNIQTNLAGSGVGTFNGDATFAGGNPPYIYTALPAGFLTDNGDGTATIDPSKADPGCYTISYTFTDNLFLGPNEPGCYQAIEAEIIVNPSDDPTFTVSAPVCPGDAPRILSLDNPLATWPVCSSPAPTDGDRVKWYGGDGANITVVDNGNGTGTLTVSATATAGVYTVCSEVGVDPCKSTYCVDVVVSPSYTAADAALIPDNTQCLTPNQLFSFHALLDIDAKLGGTFTAVASPASLGTVLPNGFVYAQGDGLLTVTYTLSNCDGSSVSDQVILTIDEAPSGTFSLPSAVCQDAGVQNPVFNAQPNFTYAWSQSPLAPPAFVDPVTGAFDPAEVGLGSNQSATVQVTMTVSNGVCANHTQTQVVVVNASGNPAFTIPATVCDIADPLINDDVILQLNSDLNDGGTQLHPDNVTWTGTGVTDAGLSGTFNPDGLAVGTYTICVTVGSPSCEKTECHDITVGRDYTDADVALVADFDMCMLPDQLISFSGLLDATALAGGNFSVTGTTGTVSGTVGSTSYLYQEGCGTITIRYQFNDDCDPATPTFDEVTITIEQKANNVSISEPGPVCVTDTDIQLVLNQDLIGLPICGDDGTFFGAGITNIGNGFAVFDPEVAGEGTHVIFYQIGGATVSSCVTTTTATITVNAASDPTFTLPAVVCIADIPAGGLPLSLDFPHVSVQAGSAGNTDGVSEVYWFGGLGSDVTDNADETGVFNPSMPGTFTICVTTGDVNCSQTYCKDIVVTEDAQIPVDCYPAGTVAISLPCATWTLGSQTTSSFLGALVGYPNPINVTISTEYHLGIFDLEGLLCAGSTLGGSWVMVSEPAPLAGIGTHTGAVQGNSLYFTEPGTYVVRYTVGSPDGSACVKTQDFEVMIGEEPQPNFDIPEGICWDGDEPGASTITFDINDYVTSPAYASTPSKTYSSSDPSVATVDPTTGIVTIVGWGVTTICYIESIEDPDLCQKQVCETLVVSDNVNPTALCKDIVVDLDVNGDAAITADDVNNGSYDNCDTELDLVIDRTDFHCADIGYQVVILTVTDDAGNTHQCSAQVLVRDVTPPSLTCPATPPNPVVTLSAAGLHKFVLADFPGFSATDACGPLSYAFAPPIVYCEDAESIVDVEITVTDGSGNASVCTIAVHVDDVTEPPIDGVCHDITIEMDELGHAGPVTMDDLVGIVDDECGQITLISLSTPDEWFNCLVPNSNPLPVPAGNIVGIVPMEVTYTDNNGNMSNCTGIVTILDTRKPVINCKAVVTKELDPVTGCVYLHVDSTMIDLPYDNCGLEYYKLEDKDGSLKDSIQFCCDNVGLNSVTVKAKDLHDNVSYCTLVVEVVDTTAPVIDCTPVVRVFDADPGLCSTVGTGGEMDIVISQPDNCPPLEIHHNYPAAPNTYTLDGAVFPVGSTIVDWKVTDASGNVSECSVEIIVEDNEDPTVAFCPGDINASADADVCGAVISYPVPLFEDNCDGTDLLGTLVSGYAPGTLFPVGTTNVNWVYTDHAGNATAICSFSVIISDDVTPVAKCQPAYTISSDASGQFEILVTDIDNGSWDNCGLIVRREISRDGNPFSGSVFATCDDIVAPATSGSITVTLEVEDQYGNTDQCQTTVTVNDYQVPDIECPSNIYVGNDLGECSAVVSYDAPTVTDNCDSPVVQTAGLASGSAFPVGTTLNVFSTTDIGGNIETCSFLVVVSDTEKPVMDCTPLVRVESNDDGLCSFTVAGNEFDVTATDNCSFTLIHSYPGAPSTTTLSGATFPVGITFVTWIAEDYQGNDETCTVQIVIEDTEDPTVNSCPSDIVMGTDPTTCGAIVTYALPSFNDNCDGLNLFGTLTSGYASGTLFPEGTTTVTWEYTDLANNGTAVCNFTVTVEDDDAPTAICTISYDAVLGGDGLHYVIADDIDLASYDNCQIVSTEISRSGGVTFLNGIYVSCDDIGGLGYGLVPVTLQVTDAAGNTSTCQTTVLVYDVQVPDIECPGNYTVVADPDECSVIVDYPLPTVTDNCDYTLIQIDGTGLTTGDAFPVGTTIQTWEAVDVAGNNEICTFSIIVIDEIPPVLDCGDLVRTAEADADECTYTVIDGRFDPTATDNCDGVIITHNYPNAVDPNTLEGSTFPVGTTLVTWIATDVFGNQSPICGIEIVIEDEQDPTIVCAGNVTVDTDEGECSYYVASTDLDPTFGDNCPGAVLSHNFVSAPHSYTLEGAVFPVGTTTIVWTVTDASGNTATCTSTVTVEDNEAPEFVNCPTTMVMIGNDPDQCSGKLNWSIPVATDNCGLLPPPNGIVQTGGPASGTVVAVGFPQTITYTATDIYGNTSSCVFQVQVVDTQKPKFDADIVMPTNITVQCDAVPDNCVFHGNGICSPLTNDDVNDNCTTPEDLVITFTETSTQNSNVNDCGHYNYTLTRTWTVTDEAGNQLIHVQVITVQDTQAPTPVCQNTTITLDKFGNASIDPKTLIAGTTDNCAPFSALTVTASKTGFNCSNLGENNVTLTIKDPCQNTATCEVVVTVVEGIAPCVPEGAMASTCLNNATTLTNGQFSELVTLKSLAGQTWTIVSSVGLYTDNSPNPPAAPTAVANGTQLIVGNADGIDNNGNGLVDEADEMIFYTLKSRYVEAIGYSVTITNNLGETMTLSNVGHYPTPALKNWYPPFCFSTPVFTPEVTDLYAGDGQYTNVTFILDGNPVTQIDPSTLSSGLHTLVITVDAGGASFSRKVNGVLVPGDAANSDEARLNPGCIQSITEFFNIVTTPAEVACNDLVQITLDPDCYTVVIPEMVLEGTYPCFDDYEVHISWPGGVPLNPFNVLTGEHAGKTLHYSLWHPISGNTCWGDIKVEDKTKPVPTCPDEVTILCTVDPDSVVFYLPPSDPRYPAKDYWGKLVPVGGKLLYLGEPTAIDCSAYTWQYTDSYTVYEECANNPEVAVFIVRTFVITDAWGNQASCTQNITKNRGEAADVVFPGDLQINCNDPILAGLVASNFNPAQTGWPTIWGTNVTTTGTGICGLGISYTDEIVNMCVESYKVVRTWKIFDWCPADGSAPSQTTYVQYILVKNVAPTITVDCADIDPATGYCILNATEPGIQMEPCYALLVPFAQVDGVCDAIKSITVETPNGFTTNGGIMPAPGLPVGGPYDIVYRAEDQCGNITQYTLTVLVKDKTAPVAVCDQHTSVNLTSNGTAVVFAETYDDGSHDNCCLDHFSVRRMTDNCAIPGNTQFGPSVTFCCSDIEKSPITVVFRAYDCNGNFNDCMVTVDVNDKIVPIIVSCPSPTVREDCDWYAGNVQTQLDALSGNQKAQSELLDQYFGNAEFFDNCDLTINRTFTRNIDMCLDGTITRTWQAVDPSGNTSQSCTQTIFIDHVSDWSVEFPADQAVTCGTDVPAFGEPLIFNETCELVAISYSDELFAVGGDTSAACYKIVRTWVVINWCVVGANVDQEVGELSEAQLWNQGVTTLADRDINGDGFFNSAEVRSNKSHRTFRDSWNNVPGKKHKPVRADNATNGPITDPDTDPDSDPWDGYITYQQIIMVTDNVAPVFANGCTIPDVCIEDNTCAATVILPQPEIQDCSVGIVPTVSGQLGTGYGPFTNVAPGTYTVKYVAKDFCNNQTECNTTVTVKDCKKPTPYCVNGLVIGIDPPDPHITVWASDFDAGSFDNCPGPLKISFSADVNDISKTYYCDSLGIVYIEMWVTDAAGNQDYCKTFLEIQDNFGVCNDDNPLIAGVIETEQNEGVAGVEVQLSGASQSVMTTGNQGVFSFSVVPGSDYTVTPVKDIDPLNGVTTFDLVLISKHILGVTPLNSPYKIIAADANNSSTVTTYDLVQLRKLILFIDTDFPNNTSWRFVDKDYVFPNPSNPWSQEFAEIISINNVTSSQLAANFVAIKVGDVNGSAVANLLGAAEDRNMTDALVFALDNEQLTAGEEYTVDFKAKDFDVLGYQFTLNFDRSVLDFVQIIPAIAGNDNFGLTLLDEGAITTSWNDNDTRLSDGDVVFSLVFRAKANAKLSDLLSVNSRYTRAEAYQRDGELLDVELTFNTGKAVAGGFELYQNTPNPFNSSTVIGFNLPETTNATLTITDVSGRVVKMVTGEFVKGYNEVRLERREMPTAGILYYQLDTPTDSATKMMLLID